MGGLASPSATLDEVGFARITERLERTVTDLRSGLDSFDPREARPKGGAPGAPPRAAVSGEAKKPSEEELERRAERLEAYKMARRLEPELPPLQRNLESDVPPKTPPDQAFVARNATDAEIHRWSSSARRARLLEQRSDRDGRTQAAIGRGKILLQAARELYVEDLARKRVQGEEALAARSPERSGKKPGKLKRFAQQWLAMYAVAAVTQKINVDLKAKKIQNTNGEMRKSLVRAVDAVLIAMEAGHPVVTRKWGKLAGLYYVKMQAQRGLMKMLFATWASKMIISASTAASSAGSSRPATTFHMSSRNHLGLQLMTSRVRKLQRWWRECSRMLLKVHERMSQRWERLERLELLKEHRRRELGERPNGRPGARPKGGLGVEDFIQWERISDEDRRHFLKRELRARRYFVLPMLQVWQQDSQQWRALVGDSLEHRAACSTLGVQRELQMFQWPPIRPSCLPPAHPAGEARGLPCVEGCCGRRGDLEIISMIQRAREGRDKPEGGGGWLEIPSRCTLEASSTGGGGPPRRHGHIGMGPSPAESAQASTRKEELGPEFSGEATDAELKEWGADPSEMPCLQPGMEPPVPPSPS